MFALALLPLLLGAAAATSPYKPTTTTCPTGSLIRDGNTALSDREEAYRVGRKAKADVALSSWLEKQSAGLGSGSMPTVALSNSGGGWRALLIGAGVVQGMDDRDSDVSTSGLLQALTYHIGISGGGWLVASLAGNNFPTVTQLKEELWLTALKNGIEDPEGWKAPLAYADIASDILQKHDGGYPVSLADAWSRLLSYQFLEGDNGGVSIRFSDVASYSNMTEFNVPLPIIDANGVDAAVGHCNPENNGTVWEFTPFDFGSWDDDVSAWIPIEYLGTAAEDTDCTLGFDNLGFILGTSSTLFGYEACVEYNPFSGTKSVLDKILKGLHDISDGVDFARVPNPFKGMNSTIAEAKEVFSVDELYLVDGGIGLHNDPVAPLLEPARGVDVIILSDQSADSDNFPDGECLVDASWYVKNISRIADRMPTIPDVATFVEQGLNKRAVFFGCDEPETVTIVWLPNTNYTYESNLSTAQFQYGTDVTNGMIANGVEVATQNGDEGWGLCLACAIMMKEEGATLPDGCDACFEQWCYHVPVDEGVSSNTTNVWSNTTITARSRPRELYGRYAPSA